MSSNDDLFNRFEHLMMRMRGPAAERAVTEMQIQAMQYSDEITPIDTGNLINSRYRNVRRALNDSVIGVAGYTAEYAAFVHESSGKLRGQPREHFGRTRAGEEFGGGTGVGNYWDPSAEPQFLQKGIDKMISEDYESIIERNLGLD